MKPLKTLAIMAAGLSLFLVQPSLADDISNGSWNTTDNSNNASPPNGWPAGMFPNQVEPAARADKGGVKRWWERGNPTLSTTGSAGAYVLTPSNASYPTAYTQGEIYCAKANFTSIGNDTLNVNGLGAKPIYSAAHGNGVLAKIIANEIIGLAQFCVAYDGALNSGSGGFQLLSQSVFSIPNNSGTGPAFNFTGSTQLPGGLIMEFGYLIAPGPSGTTVALPIAFPNALIGSVASVQQSASAGHVANTYPIDSQHIGISSDVNGGFVIFWTAFGY